MKQNEDVRDTEQIQETQEQVDTQDTQEAEAVAEATEETSETEGAEESKAKRIPKKRVAIACGVVVALIAGAGAAWAAGVFDAEEETTPTQTTVTNTYEAEDDAIVEGEATVVLTPIAEGFDEESSPFIAHITGESAAGDTVDFYHAVWADGSTSEVELEQGDYEITWISAVNSDGSIYDTVDIVTTFSVSAEDVETTNEATSSEAAAEATGDEDQGEDEGTSASAMSKEVVEVEQEFEAIAANDVTEEDIETIFVGIEDAVANGDETLTGSNGTTVVGIVEENTIASDSDSGDEEEAEDSDDETSEDTSKSSTSSSSSSSGSSSSSSKSSSSSSSHSHNWIVYSDYYECEGCGAKKYDVAHNHSWTAVSSYYECKGCGAQFSDSTSLTAHLKEGTINRTSCTSYCTKQNYTCSCGATKQDW